MVNNARVKHIVEKFNQQNGNKAFTLKDLIIYFNTEQIERSQKLETKLDDHIRFSSKTTAQIWKAINEHDKIIQHIADELPEKGFCDKTQSILNSWHPNKSEPSLDKKVDILWYDRKIIKWLVGALIISTLASVGSLVTSVFS